MGVFFKMRASRQSNGYTPVKHEDSSSDSLEDGFPTQTPRSEACTSLIRKIWISHGALFVLWIVMFVVPFAVPFHSGQQELYSPVPGEVIEYSPKPWSEGTTGIGKSLTKEPDHSNEKEWAEILKLGFIDLSTEEASKLSNQSLDASQRYVGSMGIFQQLHCLYKVRRMFYLPETAWHTGDYIESCIEVLGQAIMCNGNVAIDVHTWDKTTGQLDIGIAPRLATKQCRDFDKLMAWAGQRRSESYWKVKPSYYWDDEQRVHR